MGEVTGIQWTHHTANFWIGCERVSPACDFCYADRDSKRLAAQHGLKLWDGDRYITKTAADNVRKWNRRAEAAGERRRVFCMSFGDLLEDRPDLEPIRQTVVWPLIPECPWLDFLVLTKRPENFRRMLPAAWLAKPLPNVWLGTTVEDQERADKRLHHLLTTPAAIHFTSYEPALGPVDFTRVLAVPGEDRYNMLRGSMLHAPLDWVIVGGESGPHARPFDVQLARWVVNQCEGTTAAPFVKQLGAKPHNGLGAPITLKDHHGGEWDEWPAHIPRVREFPKATA